MILEKIKKIVYNFPSKYAEGLLYSEIEDIKGEFDLSEEHFNDAMSGNTCVERDGQIVNYRDDVVTALMCGIERRGMHPYEFD